MRDSIEGKKAIMNEVFKSRTVILDTVCAGYVSVCGVLYVCIWCMWCVCVVYACCVFLYGGYMCVLYVLCEMHDVVCITHVNVS